MQITKSNIEIYYLRKLEDGGWADIAIDEGENSGRISISSDWGNWANYWGACGEPFKKFLCGLDMHYFATKVGEGNWLDTEKTLKNWKREVLQYRRSDDIGAKYARKIFDELKELEDVLASNFLRLAYEKENFMEFHNYEALDTHTSVSPRFKAFWEKAYKPFCEHLKNEVQ